ncbi:MAG TPA: SDR family NAD(P)-dependent oxidoreductase [Candidatus Tumulicola sp.]
MPDARRVLIVTGASSGIGRSLAMLAAADGFAVLLVARRAERLAEVARAIRAAGGACETLTVDVTAAGSADRIADAARRAFGRIDVVVNNAGAGAYGELLAQSDAALDAQWRLNVAAPLHVARAVLPDLERTRGQLVFVGSGIARVPLPSFGAYAPAKAAIRAAAIQLRRELRGRGIAVTYVDPGVVATEFHSAMGVAPPARVSAASPERVARAILRGIGRRAATVNAVPTHTAAGVAAEWLASLADPVVARMAPERRGAPTAIAAENAPPPAPPAAPEPSPFEAALEPVARRMERVKLPPSFVREALTTPGATIELNEIAMRWAGMPNKNERAAMREVLDALSAAGHLEPIGDETWKVLRAAG